MTMSEASSHQNARSSASVSETTDDTNATVIASAISSIIAGLAVAGFVDTAGQEWPAAVEEDDGAEHRCDPLRSGKGKLVVEPVLDLLGEDEDRNRKGEVAPERDAEHVGVTGMTTASAVTGVLVRATGAAGSVSVVGVLVDARDGVACRCRLSRGGAAVGHDIASSWSFMVPSAGQTVLGVSRLLLLV